MEGNEGAQVVNPDDDALRLQFYRETGQHEEEARFKQYLHETGRAPQPKLGQMGHPIVDESPEEASYAQKALGGIASMVKDIPGAEALQAGARSFFRAEPSGPSTMGFQPTKPQPYTEALSEVRGAEDAAPKWVRRANRIIGGTVAAAATPGKSVLAQGAGFGAASGLAKADPMPVGERVMSGGREAVVGALAGKLAQGLGTAGRTIGSRTLDRVAQMRRMIMETADKANYGKAAVEGSLAAANPTPQIVNDVMSETDIRPYIEIVRSSRTLKGADDATVIREAYKLMSERQGTLANRVVNANDFKAGTELEKADIGAAKKRMLAAADGVMPSFRSAVYQHAERMRELQAFRMGADVTNRISRGTSGAAKNVEKNSPDTFMQSIEQMTPAEAKAALQGVLGRLKERTGVSVNVLTGFRIPRSVDRINTMAPFIEALDKKAGNATSSLTRALGIASGESASH